MCREVSQDLSFHPKSHGTVQDHLPRKYEHFMINMLQYRQATMPEKAFKNVWKV